MEGTNKKYSFLDYTGLSLFWSKIKNIIEDNELVTATALTNLDTRVDTIEDALSNQTISITYTDLKALRDSAQLVTGQQYRITDYTCTTTTAETKSAGHVFDIIVIADSESTLNEIARAIQHEGDEYFADSNLSVWKLWYCLDNDTERFAWADTTNGKGVIYRMIDEYNNDVPYDFKNIQFYRQWDSTKSLWSTIADANTGVPCYTFSSEGDSSTTEFTDSSTLPIYSDAALNFIESYIDPSQYLNNICFFGTVWNNRIHSSMHITIGRDCVSNNIGFGCYDITIGNQCQFNHIGIMSSSIYFGAACMLNSFEEGTGDIYFGEDCLGNSIGSNSDAIHFGDHCSTNTLGKGNGEIYFGDSCCMNTLGNSCSYIKFASNSSAEIKYNYYQNNHFGDGCRYIIFKGKETGSDSVQVQNYNFAQGLQGTSDEYLTIDGVRNLSYETKVAKNSKGEIKQYCEADLIN